MKTINELNISPLPWKDCGWGDHNMLDGNENVISRPSFDGTPLSTVFANVRLMASAPELYQELYKFLFESDGSVNCKTCQGAELGNCQTCPLGQARNVLKKASGETK